MTISVVDAAAGERTFVASRGGGRTLLRVLALQDARVIRTRFEEDAAIDEEDILTQAEEANALDPVG